MLLPCALTKVSFFGPCAFHVKVVDAAQGLKLSSNDALGEMFGTTKHSGGARSGSVLFSTNRPFSSTCHIIVFSRKQD